MMGTVCSILVTAALPLLRKLPILSGFWLRLVATMRNAFDCVSGLRTKCAKDMKIAEMYLCLSSRSVEVLGTQYVSCQNVYEYLGELLAVSNACGGQFLMRAAWISALVLQTVRFYTCRATTKVIL